MEFKFLNQEINLYGIEEDWVICIIMDFPELLTHNAHDYYSLGWKCDIWYSFQIWGLKQFSTKESVLFFSVNQCKI